MIRRIIPCSHHDMPYAMATAKQWTEVSATWDRDVLSIVVDDPSVDPADLGCVADVVQRAVEKSTSMHCFVRRAA